MFYMVYILDTIKGLSYYAYPGSAGGGELIIVY